MPTYVYKIIKRSATEPDETFEITQSIHDPPLTRHPKTGQRVERIICPPTIAQGRVGNSDLKNAGFAKYKKTSDGNYEKQT
jgi:predicted nucleic acid-binding Zn ribbon protein